MTPKEPHPGWTPRDVADHYGFPRRLDGQDLDGRGETVAVIDLGEIVDLDELHEDFRKLGVPMPHIRIIDDGSDQPPELGTAAMESHIDLEVIGSLCPAAELRLYRCAQNFSAMASAIEAAVKDKVAVISISWGATENQLSSGTIAQVETALRAARDAGITVCAAAGDFGASGLLDPKTQRPTNADDGRVSCMYPASSPHVLACGGTELIQAGRTRDEMVWNNSGKDGLATGGGVSEQFDLPDWQKDLKIPSANRNGGTGRILPDVAALAAMRDWAFVTEGGRRSLEGGTSAVAPFYAALVTAANQVRVGNHKKRLGFLNSKLYDVARTQGGEFRTVRSGDNKIAPGGRGYEAKEGFDACTGWGVPDAGKLIRALARMP